MLRLGRVVLLNAPPIETPAAWLGFLERARAHIAAGWVSKTPDYAVKRRLGEELHTAMQQAYRWHRISAGPAGGGRSDGRVPGSWRRAALDVDDAASPAQMLAGLGSLAAITEAACRTLLASGLLGDAQEATRTSLAAAEVTQRWTARATGAAPLPIGRLEGIPDEEQATDIFPGRRGDRVPVPARPPGADRGEPGARRLVPTDPNRDPAGIGLLLHNHAGGEYTTLELLARCSYEHPDRSWAFHLAVARHAADEGRHAALVEEVAAGYDVAYGDHPTYTASYEHAYEFEPCVPGSDQELLWRLLVRGTWQEGLALDDLACEIRKRQWLDQSELVDLFRALLGDEIAHVAGALKATRSIAANLGLDVLAERERARAYVLAKEAARRETWLSRHWAQGWKEAAELAEAEVHHRLGFERTLNRPDRLQAGFDETDLAQVARWEGYGS